jgi:hypothetical protein
MPITTDIKLTDEQAEAVDQLLRFEKDDQTPGGYRARQSVTWVEA